LGNSCSRVKDKDIDKDKDKDKAMDKVKDSQFFNLDFIQQTKLPIIQNPTGFTPLFIPFSNPRVCRE
jgi:hypothetical protein